MGVWLGMGLMLAGLCCSPQQGLSDKDSDGVPDMKDACPNTPPGSRVAADGCIMAVRPKASLCLLTTAMRSYPEGCKNPDMLTIHFAFGSAVVPVEAASQLERLAEFLKHEDVALLLRGHTDYIGSDTDNLRLSQARVENVASVLGKNFGIPWTRMNTEYFGEFSPVASNETDNGRRLNRRVEILLVIN